MELISLAFLLTSLLSLYWGIYIIRLKPKEKVNRVFLLLCISLSIWSLGFSFANSAADISKSLFWRRFAAIGWTSIVSLSLHLILLSTRWVKDEKKEVFLLFLHIPALVNMYIFSFSSKISLGQYNLVKNTYGWVNQTANNVWDYIYYLYYFLYIFLVLIALWKWKDKLNDKSKIRQANLIFISLVIALALGSFIDIKVGILLGENLPQMAPLFMIFPVWIMYYSVINYDLIDYKEFYKEELIATKDDKKRIFHSISLAFYIGGILNFLFEYSKYLEDRDYNLGSGIVESFIFLFTGSIIYKIQSIKREGLKEALTILVLVASIPIVTFYFMEDTSITVWVFPVIILITSLIFTNRTLLLSTTIVSIITQRILWILKPQEIVLVTIYDHVLRIILFVSIFIVTYYVNKIYIEKIEENKNQFEFQKMVSDTSFEFVNLDKGNFKHKINALLKNMGNFFCVDRAYLFTINHTKHSMTYSNEWCNDGIDSEVDTIEEIPLDSFPWWMDQLDKNNMLYIEDVDQMTAEALKEQEQLQRQGVKSLISVPVIEQGKIQAFIGMDSVLSSKKWTQENIGQLYIVANILSSGISQIKADEEIEFMVYYDNLTNLPNRFLFEEKVNQASKSCLKTSRFISIMFIDLDNFKSVNDTIGHSGGDVLLKEVAKSLLGVLGKNDMVARFGGDEFMILLKDISDYDQLIQVADRIMKVFSQAFIVNNQEFLITASAGIATCPYDGEDSDTLVKNADIAMYKAKEKGKNQYAFCTYDMKAEVQENMELSNDLYRALEKDQLVLYYQPQIDLVTKKIKGAEVLLRWFHPRRGMICPRVFIALAEKNSLINTIGEWVFRQACLQNKKWQDKGLAHINIAVNISAIQMLNPKLADNIGNIIKETALDPKYVELEITESITIKETNHVLDTLDKLKKIGVSIAIDDFGTEYSSLSRLKVLPIDRIKIDMQFVQGIETNEKDKAITMVIINLAKSLGLDVLAEGVETEEQLEFLNRKMCDHVQGYYYYKPMPAEEMEKLLVDLSKSDPEEEIENQK